MPYSLPDRCKSSGERARIFNKPISSSGERARIYNKQISSSYCQRRPLNFVSDEGKSKPEESSESCTPQRQRQNYVSDEGKSNREESSVSCTAKASNPTGSYKDLSQTFLSNESARFSSNKEWNGTAGNCFRGQEIGFVDDLPRGPRGNRRLGDSSSSSSVSSSSLVNREKYNLSDFEINYEDARFYVIKSFTEYDIHKSIKYNVWSSTQPGNRKLDCAYRDAESRLHDGVKCPVFLFFSVNGSGQFVGLAEMFGPLDFKKTMNFWQEDIWEGFFPVKWHIIKDLPSYLFRNITLEGNNFKPVTASRDTQEVELHQGLKMLKIFKDFGASTCILDDFAFYEEKDTSQKPYKKAAVQQAPMCRRQDESQPMRTVMPIGLEKTAKERDALFLATIMKGLSIQPSRRSSRLTTSCFLNATKFME